MATETLPAGEATELGIHIPEDRRALGLEAAWELAALSETIRSLCADLGSGNDEQGELMKLRLQIRGLTQRIEQLSSVTLSILEQDDETRNLERRIFGSPVIEMEAAHA